MKFRNAVRLTIDNFSSVFKLMLYTVIAYGIGICFIYLILKLGLNSILKSAELSELKFLTVTFLRSLVSGDSAFLSTFQENFSEAMKAFLLLLGNKSGSIVGSIIGVCCMYLLMRFVLGLAQFAVADNINDRARLFARTKFYASFTKSIGKAALYQVIYVPLSFLYDACVILLCWFLFFYVPSLFMAHAFLSVLLALSLMLATVLCLVALKLTLISNWIPSIISSGMTVGAGLKASLKSKKNFWKRFGTFVVANYIIFVVHFLFTLCTFGSALLLTFPTSIIFVLCLQFVTYYEDNGLKYFVSSRKIAGDEPSEFGE